MCDTLQSIVQDPAWSLRTIFTWFALPDHEFLFIVKALKVLGSDLDNLWQKAHR